MTRVFGLTGGIASGKSTVAQLFSDQGVPMIDADALAREVVSLGTPALAEIRARFSDAVFEPDGSLARKRLAERVFGKPEELAALNAIVHPRVAVCFRQRVAELESTGAELVGYEVPLLFENQIEKRLWSTVLVAAPEALQVARATRRDGTDEVRVRARIAAQMPLEEKLKRADYVIHNDGDLETLKAQALEVLATLRARVRAET
jgi:dephospho-CoA kinase